MDKDIPGVKTFFLADGQIWQLAQSFSLTKVDNGIYKGKVWEDFMTATNKSRQDIMAHMEYDLNLLIHLMVEQDFATPLSEKLLEPRKYAQYILNLENYTQHPGIFFSACTFLDPLNAIKHQDYSGGLPITKDPLHTRNVSTEETEVIPRFIPKLNPKPSNPVEVDNVSLNRNINVQDFFKLEESHIDFNKNPYDSAKFNKWLNVLPYNQQPLTAIMDPTCMYYLQSYIQHSGTGLAKPHMETISHKELFDMLTTVINHKKLKAHQSIDVLPQMLNEIQLPMIQKSEIVMVYLARMRAVCNRYEEAFASQPSNVRTALKLIHTNLNPDKGTINKHLHANVQPTTFTNVMEYINALDDHFHQHWNEVVLPGMAYGMISFQPVGQHKETHKDASNPLALNVMSNKSTGKGGKDKNTPANATASSRASSNSNPSNAITTTDKCFGCGDKIHGWTDGKPWQQTQCPLRHHNNWNGKQTPWASCLYGQIFRKNGFNTLPVNKELTDDGKVTNYTMIVPDKKSNRSKPEGNNL